MQKQELIKATAEGIAMYEGFYKPGSRAQRNRNPGNLRPYSDEQPRDSAKYRIFKDLNTGWQALYKQVELNIERGLSLHEFFAGQRDDAGKVITAGYPGFAPALDTNHPVKYAKFISKHLSDTFKQSINIDIPLKDLYETA